MAQRAVLQGAGGALGTSAPPSPAQGLCPPCARPRPHPHGCSRGWQGSATPSLPGAASCAPAGEGPPPAYLRAPSGLLSARSPQPAAPCLWAGPSAGGDAEGPPGTASPILLLSTACWPPLLLSASSWFLHPPLFSSILLFFNLPVFSGLAFFFFVLPFSQSSLLLASPSHPASSSPSLPITFLASLSPSPAPHCLSAFSLSSLASHTLLAFFSEKKHEAC